MPKFAEVLAYVIFFYSHDRDEPIHYHVSRLNDYNNYAKIWIKGSDVVLEHNKARIPDQDMTKILKYLKQNITRATVFWEEHMSK
jgi:hypothetical protein